MPALRCMRGGSLCFGNLALNTVSNFLSRGVQASAQRAGALPTAGLPLGNQACRGTAPSVRRAPASSRAIMSGSGSSIWEAVSKHSDSKATAIVAPHQDDGALSYKELIEQASSFAGNLAGGLGYKKGDKIALVLGGNCFESIVLQLGAAFAGVTVVTAKDPRDEKLIGCRGLVVSDHVLVNAEKPNAILKDEKHPPIVCHDDVGIGAANVSLFYQAMVDQRPIGTPNTDAASTHAQYGGGSGVSQGEIVSIGRSIAENLKLTADDILCIPVPLAHPFGFGGAVGALLVGGCVVLPRSTDERLFADIMCEEDCTAFLSDAHMIKALKASGLDLRGQSPATIKGGVRGAVKVGGGQEFGLGEAQEWSGIKLVTVGKP